MSDRADGVGIRPLPVEEWSQEAHAVLPGFLRRPELYLSGGPDAKPMPQALGLFAHHVQLGAAWMGFTELLVSDRTTLDGRTRELAILRVAWQAHSNYEWKQHCRIGLANGLTNQELYAIPDGPAAPGWSDVERAVLEAVDQIVSSARVSAPTWRALAAHFDAAQLLELTFTIGGYLCFAAVASSARMEPDPPTEPLDAPDMPAWPDE